jgi:hypothetical protein
MQPSTPPAMTAASQAGVAPGNVVVILVPPNGQSVAPRLSPERPRQPLPVPPQSQPRAPGSVPGGPVRASIYMTNRPSPALLESAFTAGQTVMVLHSATESAEPIAPSLDAPEYAAEP